MISNTGTTDADRTAYYLQLAFAESSEEEETVDPQLEAMENALIENEVDSVKQLLETKVDPDLGITCRRTDGILGFDHTPLYNAIKDKSPEMIQVLLSANADLKVHTYIIQTLQMIYPHSVKTAEIVEMLLTAKANPDEMDYDTTALTSAIGKSCVSPRIVEALLEAKANPKMRSNHSVYTIEQPLYSAINCRSAANVKLLSDAKADPNTIPYGHGVKLPLFTAAHDGSIEIVKLCTHI
jgi:ankyrin repeat protein